LFGVFANHHGELLDTQHWDAEQFERLVLKGCWFGGEHDGGTPLVTRRTPGRMLIAGRILWMGKRLTTGRG
jgi:hypothetical protein